MIKTNHKIKINNRNYYIFNENNRTYVKYEGNFVEIFILQNNINNKKGGGDDAKYAFTYQIRDINNAIEKYEKIFIKRQEKILYLCVNFINKIKSTESSINNKFAKMSISSDYDRSRYLTLINKEFYENLFKKYFIVIMQTINRDSIISEQSELKKIAKYLHFITYDDNEKDKKINNDFKEFEKIGVDDAIDEIVLKENVNNSLNELNNLITTFNADKKKIIDTESLKNNVMAIKNKISKWSAPSWQEILLSTFNEDVEYINDKSEKFKSNEKYLNAILNFLSMESSDINKFDEKSMDKIKKEVEKALETIKKIPNESNNDIDIPELINLIISNIKKLLINFINKNYSKNISSIQKLKDNSKKEIEEIIKSIENYKNVLDTSTTEEIAQVLKTGSGNINENSSGNSSSGNSGSGNSGSGNSGPGNASSGNSGPGNASSGNSGSGNSGSGNTGTGNAATDKVDENGGDKVESSAGKTTITSDIPIYTEDEAEEIRKTRGAYKYWKEKGLDVDVSKIKMEISDDKTSITTWLDDPSSFDPKLATLEGNDFYLNGNILKGQELLNYVNNIKKETLKIVTRKGQEEEKYNFATNEIKGIASAPEYASTISTREQGSASAPEFPTDNFDTSKYTPSELNQRKYAMSLPTKLDECNKFKSNKEKKKCNKKYTWFEEYKKNDNEEEVCKNDTGNDKNTCINVIKALKKWGTDGTDKNPRTEEKMQGSAGTRNLSADKFDENKYTESELEEREFAMSLPKNTSDCNKFKKGFNGYKDSNAYDKCYRSNIWAKDLEKRGWQKCDEYPRKSTTISRKGLFNQATKHHYSGKVFSECTKIVNALNRWGRDGIDKYPMYEKKERELEENKKRNLERQDKEFEAYKKQSEEEDKKTNMKINIMVGILDGRVLSEEEKNIFEKDFNLEKTSSSNKTNPPSNYQYFLDNLKIEFGKQLLKKEYEKYILSQANNPEFIIDNYDIGKTTSTKNTKGNYLLRAFKLFMFWLIKKNIEIYKKVSNNLIKYYNLSICKYQKKLLFSDPISSLTAYHDKKKGDSYFDRLLYLVINEGENNNPYFQFYRNQILFKPDHNCDSGDTSDERCEFNSYLNSYHQQNSPIMTLPLNRKKKNIEDLYKSANVSTVDLKKNMDIVLKILKGNQLTLDEDNIFEQENNIKSAIYSYYSEFMKALKNQWKNLSIDYNEYIKKFPNEDKRIIDIENTEFYNNTYTRILTKNKKGYHLLHAFKLFMLWLIEYKYTTAYVNKNHISIVVKAYNMFISNKYILYRNNKDFYDCIVFLDDYHKNREITLSISEKIAEARKKIIHIDLLDGPKSIRDLEIIRNKKFITYSKQINKGDFFPPFYKEEYLIEPFSEQNFKEEKNVFNKTLLRNFHESLNTYNLIPSSSRQKIVGGNKSNKIKKKSNEQTAKTFSKSEDIIKISNQKSKYKVCTYITDVEGNMDYFNKYVNISKVIEWTSEKKNRLKFRNDDSIFIYGGDTQDRGDSDIRFVNILLKFKEDYPERVIFIIGNRDANKLRIPSELSEKYSDAQNFLKKYDSYPYWEDKAIRVTLRKYLKDNNYDLNVKNRLKYIIERTMDNNDGFEKRRNELSIILKKNISKISDNDVISSFLNSVLPKPKNAIQTNDNYMLKYLMQGQLIYIFGEHIFVHGAINEKNIGKIPKNKNTIEDINVWAKELNNWFHKELKEYMNNPKDGGITKKRKAHNIIDYVVPGDNNDISVVYANNLRNGNGVPINKKVIEQLNKYGIRNIITGHKPHGDCPLIIRDRNLKAISADTSYSNINYLKNVKKNNVNNVNNVNNIVDKRGKAVSEVLLYSNGDVRIHGILADNSKYGYIIKKNNESTSSGSSSASSASYIGLQLNNKYWVKNVKKDKYLISYGKGFDIDEKWINIEELKKLLKKP
jgi:hypothetical protein